LTAIGDYANNKIRILNNKDSWEKRKMSKEALYCALCAMIVIAGLVLCVASSAIMVGPSNLVRAMKVPYMTSGNQEIDMALGAILFSTPGGNLIMLSSPGARDIILNFVTNSAGIMMNYVASLYLMLLLPSLGPSIFVIVMAPTVSSLTYMQIVLLIGLALIALGFIGLDYNSRKKQQGLPH